MTFTDVAIDMWQYWFMGLLIMLSVWKSENKDLLRVDTKGTKIFGIWLLCITFIRMIFFHFVLPHDMIEHIRQTAMSIPWQSIFTVFWEDAFHTLPLAVLNRMIGHKPWYKYLFYPLLALQMIHFGSGHVYQGALAAVAVSFYIPFTLKAGQKYGFGTVMICHIIYDMITLISFKFLTGA